MFFVFVNRAITVHTPARTEDDRPDLPPAAPTVRTRTGWGYLGPFSTPERAEEALAATSGTASFLEGFVADEALLDRLRSEEGWRAVSGGSYDIRAVAGLVHRRHLPEQP